MAINMQEEKTRHREVVKLLASFQMYRKDDGSPFFKIKKEPISGYKTENFTSEEIARAGALLVDVFNLTGGSVGGFDLYSLLRAYFLDEQKRRDINKILGVN